MTDSTEKVKSNEENTGTCTAQAEGKGLLYSDMLDLLEYIQHDSWRCEYYNKCHCGLDTLTDKLGLRRVPVSQKT